MNALEKYQAIIRDYVKGREGIYALYKRDKLYYVGLARDLRNRLKQHLRDRHSHRWDRFSVYLTLGGDSHIKELESLALRIVKPTGNKVKGKFVRSEDLSRRFRRDIRFHQRSEEDAIFGKIRKEKPKAKARRSKMDSNRTPTLAVYELGPKILKGSYKGKQVRARLTASGRVRYKTVLYLSPSLAAAAAVKRTTQNGWTFWKFERAPGDWVYLNKLRK